MVLDILLWGLVIGFVHFIILGALYQNPFVAGFYRRNEGSPGLRVWKDVRHYLVAMALGTQVEVYLLTIAYVWLRQFLPNPHSLGTALTLGAILAGVRVYPRFWNMWIQSTYPRVLLAIEIINGTIGAFVIVVGLKLLLA